MEPTRILTIEDDPAVRQGIVAYLEDSGFQMLEADDGLVGVDLFREQRPDAVLCDLCLPGMDGLEVLSTISKESPETPVIVVSGVSVVGDAVKALKTGAWDYITKPIHDLGVLEKTLGQALERAELLRQNREYRNNLERLNSDLNSTLEQLREDVEAGKTIQHQFLPEDGHRFGDYLFTRRLFPSKYLSGDFVDYFSIDERLVGFYMADVSGHGAASAFVTVMLKTLINQYRDAHWQEGDDTICSPAKTLERLNRDLRRQNLDKFATMFFGVLDCKENTLTCGSGAQFPYPVLHDGGEARFLRYRNRPVGLFDDSRFDEHVLTLPDRFTFLLVSDGILELLPENSLHDKHEDLLTRIAASAENTLEEFIAEIGLNEATKLLDDVTFLRFDRQPDDVASGQA